MVQIPFLKPNLVRKESYLKYLEQMESSRLYSNFGPLNNVFEQRVLTEYFTNQGAVTTVNNATIGLMLAISSSKRPSGKYALMPSFTFAATPLAAMWNGLIPYFIDVDETTLLMHEGLVEQAIQSLGDDLAVVVPYATFGTWFNLSYYSSLQQRGIPVVVDAAASFGTKQFVQFGTGFEGAVVFSFHATKAFGIGEGGLIYSNNGDLIRSIRIAANFGFQTDRVSSTAGLNGKMSEFMAAVALATLDVFPQKFKVRQTIHSWYREAMTQLRLLEHGWKLQNTQGAIAHQFIPVLCPSSQQNDDFVSKLKSKSIQVRHYFSPPCHQQRAFSHCPTSDLSVTNNIATRILSLPLWEEMEQEQVTQVVKALVEVNSND